MRRRTFFGAAALGAAAVGGVTVGGLGSPARAEQRHSALVPEVFAPLANPPQHSAALVIGSGFGGSVAALRLAEAGVSATVLERGSRWPNDPWREIFTGDDLPDGRGFWHRTSFTGVTKVPVFCDDFGGVLDCTDYAGISVWRAAAVGGGSVVFTGAMVAPQRRLFDDIFTGTVDYDEMSRVWYPLVRSQLRLSPMPSDVYASTPFAHSRTWDEQVRKAGYRATPVDSIFDWDVVRSELAGRTRPSATAARSNLGNSNGAKFDLNQNYLRRAQQLGARVFPGHRVDAIGVEADGRYRVQVVKLAPTGEILGRRVLTCDQLFLAAGSIGTSELLVRAQATGALPNLNASVGKGWGSNGDVGLARPGGITGSPQGAPCASMIYDESGLPTTLENWFLPGVPFETGALASLGMVLDATRGSFVYEKSTGAVTLNWPKDGNANVLAATRAVQNKIIERNNLPLSYPLDYDANASFTAHPLGGAVLGKATDTYGRVHGHAGLYVLDGAAIPGSTGAVNPSLTITALAERNIANILRAGI